MSTMEEWCAKNGLRISGEKSSGLILGTGGGLLEQPPVHLAGNRLKFAESATYVGLTFDSNLARPFTSHIARKARHATGMTNAIFAMHNVCGDVPPSVMLKQYLARVDPHLTHGCDVVIDTVATSITELAKIQLLFLRRLLQVNPRSFKAMLFFESGLMPIRERRIIMSLQAMEHYSSLVSGPLVEDAFRVSIDLAKRGFRSWIGDLVSLINGLQLRAPFPNQIDADWIIVPENAALTKSSIRTAVGRRIFSEVLACKRVPLLHCRAARLLSSPDSLTKEGAYVTHPQGYLVSLNSPSSRAVLLRLLLAEHGLMSEMGRRKGPNAPRHCRLCDHHSESEVHVLFFCAGSPALHDARIWIEEVRCREFPSLPSLVNLPDERAGLQVLDAWLESSDAKVAGHTFWPVVAKFAGVILSIFDQV